MGELAAIKYLIPTIRKSGGEKLQKLKGKVSIFKIK